MRRALLPLVLTAALVAPAREARDTVWTRQGDKIIVDYRVGISGDEVAIEVPTPPRVIPSESLNRECNGNYGKLKVVVFDRVGSFGKVNWRGITPTAFMVPAGARYDASAEGFYILGECQPIALTYPVSDRDDIRLPLFIAIYEKKQNYRIVASSSKPLTVAVKRAAPGATPPDAPTRDQPQTQQVVITTTEVEDDDNRDITSALNCIDLIDELLARTTEWPFSTQLDREIQSLTTLKYRITDRATIDKINATLLRCTNKENELKAADRANKRAMDYEQKAREEQLRQEELSRQQEAEQKAQAQEEKQQKRTIWMIVGGAILAACAFVGNAIFRQRRDAQNRRSIMEMQESLSRQAEHEAARRAREVVNNKAHQLTNKGRSKLRETTKNIGKKPNNPKRRSI